MTTKVLTCVFLVFWTILTIMYASRTDWLYTGTSIAAVAWNASYLRDCIIRDRKEKLRDTA